MSIQSFYYPKLATLPDPWKRKSFVGIGLHWLASHDSYSPSRYKIRNVKDLGSIKKSLEDADIDPFDRQIDDKVIDHRLLTRIGRVLFYLGVFVFVPPVGVIYHLEKCVSYTASSIKNLERHPHLKEHFRSLITDLFWAIPWFVISALEIIRALGSSRSSTFAMVVPFPLLVCLLFSSVFVGVYCTFIQFLLLTSFIAVFTDRYALVFYNIYFSSYRQKECLMKEKFGIVGENGWLLSYDPEEDRETYRIVEGKAQCEGYFADLREKQALKILTKSSRIVTDLKLRFRPEEVDCFAKNPRTFLEKLQKIDLPDGSGQSNRDERLQQSITELKKCFDDYKEAESILDFMLSYRIRNPNFIYSAESCRPCFIYLETPDVLSLRVLFENRLKEIKDSALQEGGPNDDFIKIKRTILQANNPYEVLGLRANAPKESCREAYLKISKSVHPDKLFEMWKKEGEELFKVIKAANEYIESLFEKDIVIS